MFWIDDARMIYATLSLWDQSSNWRDGPPVAIAILGGGAVAFYDAHRHRATADLDLWLVEGALSGELVKQAEELGFSFRASGVAWVEADWQSRIRWSSWRFKHLHFGWFDPHDWVITKLGRWLGHDMDDTIAVVTSQNLDPFTLHDRVHRALLDYIGDERNVRMAWVDLVNAMGWSSEFRTSRGPTQACRPDGNGPPLLHRRSNFGLPTSATCHDGPS